MKSLNLVKVCAVLGIALVFGMFLQSCDKKSAPTQVELEGLWVLKSLNGLPAAEGFKGALPTLEFNFQDSIVSGTSGCNRYTGKFTYKDGNFAAPNLASTRMLCLDPTKEPEFLLELTNEGNTLSIVNGILTIAHDEKVVMEFEKNTAPKAEPLANIEPQQLDGTWRLKNINGQDAVSKFGKEDVVPTLIFNIAENKIGGKGGCNGYGGSFSLNNNQLIIGQLIKTQMACLNMEAESEYLKALSDTTTVALPSSDVLQISKNGGLVLEFSKAATDSVAPGKK